MRAFALLFFGVVVGWAASGVDWTRDSAAQDAPKNPVPSGLGAVSPELQKKVDEWRKEAADYSQINRYQISATDGGCYRVDTATGRMWHVTFGAKPRVIAGEVEVAKAAE